MMPFRSRAAREWQHPGGLPRSVPAVPGLHEAKAAAERRGGAKRSVVPMGRPERDSFAPSLWRRRAVDDAHDDQRRTVELVRVVVGGRWVVVEELPNVELRNEWAHEGVTEGGQNRGSLLTTNPLTPSPLLWVGGEGGFSGWGRRRGHADPLGIVRVFGTLATRDPIADPLIRRPRRLPPLLRCPPPR